jgi:oligosaccharide repeat unit polymerase
LTTKANVLFWLIFATAAYLSFSERKSSSASAVTKYFWLGCIALAVIGLLFGVQLSRGGAESFDELGGAAESLAVAALGHVFALRHWFDAAANWIPLTFGSRTFAGVFEVLGFVPRELGLYGEQNVDVGDSYTNVYSALRGLIEDAGLPMSFALFAAIGWSGARFERRAGVFARACLAVQLAWLIASPIASIFGYNSLLLACIMFAATGMALTTTHTKQCP